MIKERKRKRREHIKKKKKKVGNKRGGRKIKEKLSEGKKSRSSNKLL
jgi:hypothetical protein